MRWLVPFVVAACGAAPSPLDEPPPLPSPPLAAGPIAIDARLDEPTWQLDSLHVGDARLLRDATALYIFVDVRDRDLQTGDHVDLVAGAAHRTLAVTGTLPAQTARLVDGTVDDPHDDDRGVRYELAIPLAELGPRPIAFSIDGTTASLWP